MRPSHLLPTCGLLACLAVAGWPSAAAAQPGSEAFEKRIRPVLVEKCVSCHGPEKQKGGLRLDSREALLAGGDRGPAVVPGKPAESFLLRTLAHDGEVKMPPKSKLATAEIAAFAEWVRAGAPWPANATTPAGPAAAPAKPAAREFTAEERAFWAFRPVTRVEPPKVRETPGAVRNDIDRFLLAKLQANGLGFAPPADRRVLIRRLTFDLTGLPPTPAEVEAFARDDAPDAYPKAVERLLASPAYGEKWGRRWLDVARYADSNGMDENLAYVNAWRYRDWVINAVNADVPYDRFVREQLAGDLIPGGTDAERAARVTATGFLVIGPKMLAEDDPVKMRMDIIDEQLDTIGQSILGMTFGCARCHDHKFDPVTMGDYYGLAGILYSTRTMKTFNVVATWNERTLGTPAQAAALAEYEKQAAKAKAALAAAERKQKDAAAARLADERKRLQEYVVAAAAVARGRKAEPAAGERARAFPAGSVVVEAEDYTRGNLTKLRKGYGEGVGVVINGGQVPNVAEYEVAVPAAGAYRLHTRYAAVQARGVKLFVNRAAVPGEVCAGTTGSWNPDSQAWAKEGVLTLPAGTSVLRFERDGPFPHLDQFALVPADATPTEPAPEAKPPLLASVVKAWADVIRERKGVPPAGDDLRTLADSAEGPFRLTPAVEAEIRAAGKTEVQALRDRVAAIEKAKPAVDQVMAVEEAKPENLRVHLRGNHLTLGEEAPRRVPRIMAGASPPTPGADRSGRLEFADWLTRPDHPLTARVMVNRIWAGHFGTGLVRSVDNFGRLGERPTHPELLDWLAAEFVRSGWSVKAMHRLIVSSAAYRMGTQVAPGVSDRDPENRLYSHFNRRRLTAEEIRDGMLAVAGLLDRTPGGQLLQATPRQYVNSTGSRRYDAFDAPRRSVYLPVIRSGVYDVLQTLDFPDPSVPNGQRTSSTIPTQALLMLNSGLADRTADGLAAAALAAAATDGERVEAAFRRALGRAPTSGERGRVLDYLKASEAASPAGAEQRKALAWRGFCRVLLASNEFVFVE